MNELIHEVWQHDVLLMNFDVVIRLSMVLKTVMVQITVSLTVAVTDEVVRLDEYVKRRTVVQFLSILLYDHMIVMKDLLLMVANIHIRLLNELIERQISLYVIVMQHTYNGTLTVMHDDLLLLM